MAAPKGARVVGAVAIKAIPDVTDFNRALQGKLRRLPEYTVVVKAELAEESVQKMRRQIESLAERIDVTVRPRMDRTAMADVQREQSRLADEAVADEDRRSRQMENQARRTEDAVKQSMNRIHLLQREIARNFDRDVSRGVTIDERYLQAVEDKFNDTVDRMRDDLELKFEATLPEAELLDVRAKVNALIAENSGRDITFFARLSAAVARSELAILTRDRVVNIVARVNRSALSAAGQTLAYLSGVRMLGESGRAFTDFMRTLDKNLPKLAFMFTTMTTTVGAVIGLVTSMLSFGAGLVKMSALLLPVPGLILGAVTALGLMSVAWADVGQHLDSLTPKFERLGDIISGSYWEEAREPILDLVNGLMPQLEAALRGASRALGGFTGALADAFSAELADGRLERIFEHFEDGFDVLSEGAEGYAGVIVNLAEIGGKYFPQLAGWLNRIAGDFDSWLTDIQTDGRLEKWIREATQEMNYFWDGLVAGGGMLRGFWRAAEAAGAGGMAGFARVMEAWDAAVNSPGAQFALTQIFAGGRAAAASFANAIGHVLDGIGKVSPLVRDMLTRAGSAFEELGRLFGGIFGAEGLWTGFSSLFGDLRAAFERLGPAAEPFANKMGEAAEFAGELAAAFSGPMADAIIALEEPVTRIFDALGPLAADMGEWLSSIITSDEAAGVLDSIASAVEEVAEQLSILFENEALDSALYDALVILDAVIQGIEGSLPGVNALLDTTIGLLDTLLPRLKSAETTGDFLGRAMGGLAAYASLLPMMVEGVFRLGTALVVTLDTGVRFVRAAVEGVFNGLVLMGRWVGDVFAAVWDGIANWDFASIGTRIEDINIDYGRMFDDLNTEVEGQGAFAAEQFERAWNDYNQFDADFRVQQEYAEIYAQQGAEAAQAFLDSVTGGVSDGQPDLDGAVGAVIDSAASTAVERAANANMPGAALVDGIATGVAMQSPAAAAAAGAVVDAAIAEADRQARLANVPGAALVDGIATGAQMQAGVAVAATGAVIDSAVAAARERAAGGRVPGSMLADGMATGVSNNAGRVTRATTGAVAGATAAASGAASAGGQTLGANIGQGIADGISWADWAIRQSAVSAVRRALAAAQGAAEVASPSRLFRREVGAYIGEGIALGIEDGHDRIAAAASASIPSPNSIDWSGSLLDQGGGAGMTVNNTFVSRDDARRDAQEVMWELQRLKMGGRV